MTPCESCHGGCCRSFAVPISGADIYRIFTKLGRGFWDFVLRWADPQGAIARNHAPQFHFNDDPETPFVICLKTTESMIFSGTHKCRFLMECPPDDEHPHGSARCGIYQHRPQTCRVFPAKLDSTNELAVIYDVPARGRDGDHPAYNLCSRPWTPADLDPIETVQDLVVARYEMNFFHKLAEIWNRNPQAWEHFPNFLEIVYSSRVVREAAEQVESEPVQTFIFRTPTSEESVDVDIHSAPQRRAA